jgi:hypothetical protein
MEAAAVSYMGGQMHILLLLHCTIVCEGLEN